jgi:hypothetical protein
MLWDGIEALTATKSGDEKVERQRKLPPQPITTADI